MLQDNVKLPLFAGLVPLMLSPRFCSKDSVVGHDLIVQDEPLCAQPHGKIGTFTLLLATFLATQTHHLRRLNLSTFSPAQELVDHLRVEMFHHSLIISK